MQVTHMNKPWLELQRTAWAGSQIILMNIHSFDCLILRSQPVFFWRILLRNCVTKVTFVSKDVGILFCHNDSAFSIWVYQKIYIIARG